MAFKLNKKEAAALQDHIETLRKKAEAITDAEAAMQQALSAVTERVNDAIREYNGALADARTFVEEHAENWRNDYDDKSDGWREGERGEAADSFISDWENVSFDDIEEVAIVEPDAVEANHADELEGLPMEVDG